MIGGRYEVVREIGRGGTATVYEARHRWSHTRVAVKVLHADDPDAGGLAARFLEEARSTSRLSHPSIVRVFDFGQDENGVLYLVQELIEGEHLGKYLERKGRVA